MSANSMFAMLSDGIFNHISIRPLAKYMRCDIKTSIIHKLPLILELYETVTEIKLIIDEPIPVWPQMLPHQMRLFHDIKSLFITCQAGIRMRPNMLPDNLWLIFPNLTRIYSYDTYIPPDNLQGLNLSVFHIEYSKSRLKSVKPRIQEIIDAITSMTTLTTISISTGYPVTIQDALFANNPGFKNIWINDIVVNNIPSITNCSDLRKFKLIIDISTNPYILDLQNINEGDIEFPESKLPRSISDDIFNKPLFTTFTNYVLLQKIDNVIINKEGDNYKHTAQKYTIQEYTNEHLCIYFNTRTTQRKTITLP
jgi:hypothetical protein